MSLAATLFLVGGALLGVNLIRRATARLRLSHAEQLLWGTVAGWMLTTLGAYAVALAAGRMSPGPLKIYAAACTVVAVALWWPTLARARRGPARLKSLGARISGCSSPSRRSRSSTGGSSARA